MSLSDSNSGMYMPVAPAYGGGGMGGFGGWGDGIWLILLVLFAIGGNGFGFGGGWGGMGGMYEFPWLLNGQAGINANTNAGFDHAATQSAIGNLQTTVTSGFGDVQTALCGGFAGVNATVNNAQNAIAQQLYTNQIADLERSFNAQTASTQGMSAIQSQLAQCCCDNRLATCQTQNIVQNEGNATRFADANNTRDIIDATNRNGQLILDKLCSLELDAKNDTINQLRQELLYARGQASQDVQTAVLRQSDATTANQLVQELRSCPIPAMPVYGQTPIFHCNGNNGCGCGCGGNAFYN